MITWYADVITADFNDPNLWNRFLEQHIESGDTQNFTTHPQLDSSIFKMSKQLHEFKPFTEYKSGNNLVIIGLHGGWTTDKLKFITQWFKGDPNRLKAWKDPQCRIVLDYSEEGFTVEVFADVWEWIEENNLHNRVLYISSSCNVEELYNNWCYQNRIYANMESVWYGFFATWLLRDRIMCGVESNLPIAQYNGGKRYMCLNRRPHPHRILLLTLLERFKLIDKGAVSMPRNFSEVEIVWEDEAWDIKYQWNMLKDRFNGHIDALENNFQSLYDKLPLIADTENFAFNYALNINSDYYKDYPINVISETLFFSESAFASEKIWKPILLGQIFLPMASQYYLQSLRSLGFKTFSPYIDEEYDLMVDPIERAFGVVRSLKKILALSEDEFKTLLVNCKPILEHNRLLLEDSSKMEKLISKRVMEKLESNWTRDFI